MRNHTAVRSQTVPLGGFDYRVPALAKIEGVAKKTQLLSVAAYFGLAPFLWFSGVARQQNHVLKHHTRHSLGFAFLLLIAVVLYEIVFFSGYVFIVHVWKPSLEEFYAASPRVDMSNMVGDITALLAGVYCAVGWMISLAGASRGRTPKIPLLSSLFTRTPVTQVGLYWSLFLELLILVFVGMGIRSAKIASLPPPKDAKVYVLYTKGGYLPVPGLFETFTPPRWFMTLGFYPLVQAGMQKYGEEGVAVLPLTPESFGEAIQHGKFIFVASHGGSVPGSFSLSISPHIQYLPKDIELSRVGEDLQFVYFAGCFTGKLETEWKETLGIDQAVLFDRLSSVDEHMMWVWFKSASVIADLK